MFSDDFCEDWESTRNQDIFIKKYFRKKAANSTTKNSPTKTDQQNTECSSPSSDLLKNKRSINYQFECNKKNKKVEESCDFTQGYNYEIDSQSQNIDVAGSSNYESNDVKKKSVNKSLSNESSEYKKGAKVKVIDNFSANSIENNDVHSCVMDSSCLKTKKKRKKLNNSISEEKVHVPSETQTISDVAVSNSSISDNNLSENGSDHKTLKMKKKKIKNKFKNIGKSSEPNCFSNETETVNDTLFNYSLVRKSNLYRNNSDSSSLKKKNIENYLELDEFSDKTKPVSFKSSPDLSLKKNNVPQNKAYQKLQAAKFRYLNEMLYTNSGKEALSYFQQNADEYLDYHQGFQSQVSKWPINPVDIIIQDISNMDKQAVIADFGCGEAKIAEVFPKRTVHSFDLIALKDCVTACDMANVPLPTNSVDVAVFCLSLMGTNWKDYLKESQRILKFGGTLKIAEIESRIENLQHFINEIKNFGFSLINQDLSHKMFVFLNFKRANGKKKSSKVPAVSLKPCLYKKR